MRSNLQLGFWPLLYVDDSADERLLVQEAISLTNTPFLFFGVESIQDAMPHFASGARQRFECPRPALVLLDYDLGKHTGLDFLYWLRVMNEIKSVPVVMFSGSASKDHVDNCYATGANHYVSKPSNFVRLKIIVRTLHLSLLAQRTRNPIELLYEYQPNPKLVEQNNKDD